jgi:hypothetical protein
MILQSRRALADDVLEEFVVRGARFREHRLHFRTVGQARRVPEEHVLELVHRHARRFHTGIRDHLHVGGAHRGATADTGRDHHDQS